MTFWLNFSYKCRVNLLQILYLYQIFIYTRSVVKEPGTGDFPRLLREWPPVLLLENRRKIEAKEISSRLIPRLLVVFTRQLEILVTTLSPVNKVTLSQNSLPLEE